MNRCARPVLLAALAASFFAALCPPAAAQALPLLPVYWVEGAPGTLGSVNTDGTSFATLIPGMIGTVGIDVDDANGKLYWTEAGNTGRIRRANLNGSSPVDILTGLNTGTVGPSGIALDLVNSKIYWTNTGTGAAVPSVQRANLDGSSVQTLITGRAATAIEIDSIGGKMYWSEGTNGGTNTLLRANLDGTSPQILRSGVTSYGVTIGYDATYYPAGRVYYSVQNGLINTLESIDPSGGASTILATHSYPFYGVDFSVVAGRVAWANIFNDPTSSGIISWANPDGSDPQLITAGPTNRMFNDIAIGNPNIPEPAAATLAALALFSLSPVARRRASC